MNTTQPSRLRSVKKPFGPKPKHADVLANRVLNKYRVRARDADILFALEYEDVEKLVHEDCHYCGGSPANILTRYPDDRYQGIDRVDSSKGYVNDNVVPCCKVCNYAKHTLSLEEWRDWINRLYKRLNKN